MRSTTSPTPSARRGRRSSRKRIFQVDSNSPTGREAGRFVLLEDGITLDSGSHQMPGYEFEFVLTPREVWDFHLNRRGGSRLARWVLRTVAACVFGGLFGRQAHIEFTDSIGPNSFVAGVLWATMAVLVVSLFIFGDRLSYLFAIRRVRQDHREFLEPQVVAISNGGVSHRLSLSSSEFEWQAIHDITETDKAIYLKIDKFAALVLPTRVIRELGYQPEEVLKNMRAWRATEPSRELRCPKCNYSFEGLAVQGCPECGWARLSEGPD